VKIQIGQSSDAALEEIVDERTGLVARRTTWRPSLGSLSTAIRSSSHDDLLRHPSRLATSARDPGELAAMMLAPVDRSPDRLAILEVPPDLVRTNAEADANEAIVRREFNRAKQERPGLVVLIESGGEDFPNAALIVAVHEHKWVGGRCVNGWPDTRICDTTD